MSDVPIIYAYIYYKIKKVNSNPLVSKKQIKLIINNQIKWSMPRIFNKDVFQEFINFQLIKKVSNGTYQICEHPCFNKVKTKIAMYF